MWRRTITNSSFLRQIQSFSKRTYLSENYNLNQAWEARLSTPILKPVNVEKLYIEIDTKFQQQKKISPVDVDIYANKVTGNRHMEDIADLMKKLRSTEEACNVFDSSQHALIRNYLDNDNIDLLIYVLNHRSDYGVFLDFFSANMLLDKLIKAENFKAGARVATLLALQEDFSNQITLYMSLFCCYKFLKNLETFTDLVEATPQTGESEGTEKKKKKVEEIKVRVRYIRNPYFDDHFDLENTNHLLGKTFLYLADEVKSIDEILSNSLNLLGLGLYEKFEAGNKFLSDIKKGTFYKEAVETLKLLKEKVGNLEENEPAKNFFDSLESLNTKDENVTAFIENHLKQAYFREDQIYWVHDPDKKCKSGDIVLIKEMPHKMTRLITHSLEEIVHPLGDVTCPITNKKVVVGKYREQIETVNEIIGKNKNAFDYSKAPPRGRQEGIKDFSHGPTFIKWVEDDKVDQTFAT
ncbi:CLUMA_CG016273, isoform A [Clunio marinus]|uniref:CLUMA_CG016273, isoform A n=1 Tax=Clunio marinus TaxID=568069 RepID=A0A1J1IUX2_9DIPT|nr:CLUMA_CG016273, isoform A [Clunio marinus]